jgi:predicted dehydrogenase
VRLTFDSGCVANITASRVSTFRERSLAIYEEDRHFSLDLMQGKLTGILRKEGGKADTTEYSAPQMDPVRDELLEFVTAVGGNSAPTVSGADGLRALELASRIQDCIADRQGTRHR